MKVRGPYKREADAWRAHADRVLKKYEDHFEECAECRRAFEGWAPTKCKTEKFLWDEFEAANWRSVQAYSDAINAGQAV